MMKKTLCEFKKSSELNYFSVEVSKRVCMEEKVFQTPEGKSVLILVNFASLSCLFPCNKQSWKVCKHLTTNRRLLFEVVVERL